MKNLINKVKLIWKGRAIAENLIQIKSKWKSPTFWVALLGNAGTLVGALNGVIDPKVAIIINAILTSGYNYVRGLEKAQSDGVKPFKTSSEFVMGLATMASNALIDMQTGGVSTPYLAGSSILLGHAITAARDLANMRPKEVADANIEPKAPVAG